MLKQHNVSNMQHGRHSCDCVLLDLFQRLRLQTCKVVALQIHVSDCVRQAGVVPKFQEEGRLRRVRPQISRHPLETNGVHNFTLLDLCYMRSMDVARYGGPLKGVAKPKALPGLEKALCIQLAPF